MIEARSLTKSFGPNRVVDSVSFQIERGEVVGLLGPNGAGKTTTMRMLTTFLPPDSGDATIVGHSILDDPAAVRRHIGYLPESSPLYLDMTIGPYLAYTAAVRGIRGAESRRRQAAMIESCGLQDVLDREIGQLSRGYKQRVGLAATLLHDPQFLILDEPTSGLDPNQIVDIRRLLRQVAEDKTVILSTHILQEVEAVCDRVIIIAGGQLRADSTAKELTARQQDRRSFEVAFKDGNAAIQQKLENAAFVREVQLISREDGMQRWQIWTGADCGGDTLFRWAVDEGETLVELVERKETLEGVFAHLTTGGDS